MVWHDADYPTHFSTMSNPACAARKNDRTTADRRRHGSRYTLHTKMATKTKRRSAQGRPGRPGPRGPRGPAGPRGETGKKGEQGEEGNAPTDRATLLKEVNGHIEDIYKELDVQMRRMSQIQQQVDELREKMKRLSA
jgi:hypothetical protein